ncbi:hypothetical protein [Streptomyces sp. NPDC017941]|uniref:hypothetical protein n=1 Tax=Streptomyces sp. NPDC017941 TaxID=3365018 RepID=UPI0037B726C9
MNSLPGPRRPDPAPEPGRPVPGPRHPDPDDWAEDLAHGALIGFTAGRLRAARAAALAAEDAAVQLGYVTLARDLSAGRR